MKYTFVYAEDNIIFDTEADDLTSAIKKLKRMDGIVHNNDKNKILDVRKWCLKTTKISINDNLYLKDAINNKEI